MSELTVQSKGTSDARPAEGELNEAVLGHIVGGKSENASGPGPNNLDELEQNPSASNGG